MSIQKLTALMFGVLTLSATGLIYADIVPHPGCYDAHGCVDPNAPEEEQQRQNEENWRKWGYTSPPDAYSHDADGSTWILVGDIWYVYFNNEEDNESADLDILEDCEPGWEERATAAGAFAAVLGSVGAYTPFSRWTTAAATGTAGGAGAGYLLCRLAENY